MRRLLLALTLPTVCLHLQAETTGRISGKVLNKEGKPIQGAKVNLKRLDINWTKDLIADKNGKFFQVGLEPKEFEMTVSAEGYSGYVETIKIPIGDAATPTITLLTPAEADAQAKASGKPLAAPDDPGAALNLEGREAFNLAIPLYNAGKFAEALPKVEQAYKSLSEAREKLKDDKAKAELMPEIQKIERVLGVCLAQGGTRKEEGEPYLLKALERNPKDERVLLGLIETSKAKADKPAEEKYTAMLEALRGPNPTLTYNKGVEAFNAGNNKEAKAQWLKTLEIAPTYAEAHFMLAMVEFGDNNLKGTKLHLQKYIELAPAGKNTATAKEMLKDPSLKNIK
jgi:tetratricopeptide (TPR) repeat protein